MSTNARCGKPLRDRLRAADGFSRGACASRDAAQGINQLVTALAVLATVMVIAPLVAILVYLIYKGASSSESDFFTQIPAPVGEPGGGMANSIVGSGVVLGLASLMGIPVGIAAGVYLAEFGRGQSFLGNAVRFTADVLNGVPSIVMGIAVYALVVLEQKHFPRLPAGWRWRS